MVSLNFTVDDDVAGDDVANDGDGDDITMFDIYLYVCCVGFFFFSFCL